MNGIKYHYIFKTYHSVFISVALKFLHSLKLIYFLSRYAPRYAPPAIVVMSTRGENARVATILKVINGVNTIENTKEIAPTKRQKLLYHLMSS